MFIKNNKNFQFLWKPLNMSVNLCWPLLGYKMLIPVIWINSITNDLNQPKPRSKMKIVFQKIQQFPDFISLCLTHGMGRKQGNACIHVVTTACCIKCERQKVENVLFWYRDNFLVKMVCYFLHSEFGLITNLRI